MKLTIKRNAAESTLEVHSIEEMRNAAAALRGKGVQFELTGVDNAGREVYWNNWSPFNGKGDKWRC